MKKLLAVAVILAALIATAHSADNGTIILYRYDRFLKGLKFSIDDGPLILLKKGYYYRLVVSAGNHVLTRNGFWGGIIDPQRVHVEPNQTLYFSYYHVPFYGIVFEVAENQQEAQEQASKLKRQN
jgi:hypothetical protein